MAASLFERFTSLPFISCGAPPPLVNGAVTPSATPSVPGSTAWYDCDDGYNLVGLNDIRCRDDETWEQEPTCIQKTCGDIADIPNGAYEANNSPATPGTQATISCDPGYDAVDSAPIDCQETDGGNGEPSWSAVSSCREKTCGDIADIPNGAYEANNSPATPGTQATISCDPGYDAVDSAPIECQETDGGNGEPSWSAVSSCRDETCPAFKKQEDITIILAADERYRDIDVFAMTATDAGSGLRDVTCTPEPGTYTAAPGPCVVTCTATDIDGNSCDGTYTIHLEQAKSCGSPPDIDNGVVKASANPSIPGSTTAWYDCNDGYTLEGANDIGCQDDLTWQKEPKCIAACPNGFIRFGSGRCFKLVTDPLFFDTACKRCKTEGGYLALASNAEQGKEVRGFLVAQKRSANHWINLNQLCGSWQTADFTEVSSAITWRNEDQADCAASNEDGLAQVCCWGRLPAVCEA